MSVSCAASCGMYGSAAARWNRWWSKYLTTVKPMHEQYVEPSKRRADIIMLQGGHNLVALDMLIERIRSHIGQEI